MKHARFMNLIALIALAFSGLTGFTLQSSKAANKTYDINTLAGKVASVNGTAGLQIRFSAFIQQEAELSQEGVPSAPSSPITPANILSSPLDGTTIQAPDVTVNGDTAGANQNETAVAVDPNNAQRVIVGMNDYVTRTWTCTQNGVPCSALGDGYSGTYYSNDGGQTWHTPSNLDGSSWGTLVPGITRLTGGTYDAGGDPALAFDSQGNVYYAGLGFDRTAPPNTVTVNRGTFDSSGVLHWSQPTFVNPTKSPAVFNDKEWIAADSHANSPYRDRVYVTWTRFVFNPANGRYVQSPIMFAYSSDGGNTFSDPKLIAGNVLYGQGSRPVVGPDGTLYVFWEGATRLAIQDSIYMVKSTDGGETFSKPVQVSTLRDIGSPKYTVFRVNSFPAAAVAPNGNLYVTWSTVVNDANGRHDSSVYSMSTDGGMHWSAPQADFPSLESATQQAIGYPQTQPDGSTLDAPGPHGIDTLFPAVAITPQGTVYMSAYGADVVSPWQLCAEPATPTSVGRIDCTTLGDYTNNARLDYFVRNITTGSDAAKVTTHPINTRYGFGGGFFGDYTDLAAGSDGKYHAAWTDSNNQQEVNWWYGYQFAPGTITNQQDAAGYAGQ